MKIKPVLLALVATSTSLGTSSEIQAQPDLQGVQKPNTTLAKSTLGTRISEIVARHGNPTALAVAVEGANLSKLQAPPQAATRYAITHLPDWAKPVSPKTIDNHVIWLYHRDAYTMGFLVDRLGFIDAVLVAGSKAPASTSTGLESTKGALNLGDDIRKILLDFGYPDNIERYEQPSGKAPIFALSYDIPGGSFATVILTVHNNRIARIHIYSKWL